MSEAPDGFRLIDASMAEGFEGLVGPLWQRDDTDEMHAVWGFRAETKHCNPYGMLHGGMATTLADTMMGSLVFHAIGGAPCATISLTTEFMSSARAGQWIEGRAEMVKKGRAVCFLRSEIFADDKRIMTAHGNWAIIGA